MPGSDGRRLNGFPHGGAAAFSGRNEAARFRSACRRASKATGSPQVDAPSLLARLARKSPDEVAAFEAKRDLPRFRRVMTLMTLVRGFGLLASPALACALVLTLSIHDRLLASPPVGYGSHGALTMWTVCYLPRPAPGHGGRGWRFGRPEVSKGPLCGRTARIGDGRAWI